VHVPEKNRVRHSLQTYAQARRAATLGSRQTHTSSRCKPKSLISLAGL
jgi:hypothetical protein